MADRKITDLTALAAGSQATGDLVTIVDVSEAAAADKNKKMTMENLFKGIPGDVGIGVSSPSSPFHVNGGTVNTVARFESTDSIARIVLKDNSGECRIGAEGDDISFHTSSSESERMRIDSDGRLLVGGTSEVTSGTRAQIQHTGSPIFSFARNDSSISEGNGLGQIGFYGNDGGTFQECAKIVVQADGTHANNDKPSRMVFYTTADNGSSATERMRIDSSGRLGVGLTPSSTASITDVVAGLIQTNGNIDIRYAGTSTDPSGSRYLSFVNSDSTLVANQPMGGLRWVGNDTSNTSRDTASILAFCSGNSGAASHITFNNDGGTERMRITSSGDVGIGSTSPDSDIHLKRTGADAILRIENTGNGNHSGIFFVRESSSGTSKGAANIHVESTTGGTGTALIFGCGSNTSATGGERMRLDNSGRLMIGASSNTAVGSSAGAMLQVEHDSGSVTGAFYCTADTAQGGTLILGHGRGSATGALQDDDTLGDIRFAGADGTDLQTQGARITAAVDGTPGSNDMPTRLTFSTCSDGQSSPTERMRISSSGKFTAPTIYSLTTTGGGPVYVESDGDLLRYTSSLKYKTDVETIEDARADAILNCRPVWYRSKCANDIKTEGSEKSDWGWYGFIAEEVAEIEPRLVNWATKDGVKQENGSVGSVERDPADYEAEGVRYDNFVPLLVNLVKRQQAAIETLEAKVAALEAQ